MQFYSGENTFNKSGVPNYVLQQQGVIPMVGYMTNSKPTGGKAFVPLPNVLGSNLQSLALSPADDRAIKYKTN
jgi:hypothetical protein